MEYLLFTLIAVLSTAVIILFGESYGVADIGVPKIYKKAENVKPFRGASLILIITVCFAFALAIQISLYKNTDTVSFAKLYGVFVIVMSAGLIDIKRRIIPNLLIICGLVFRSGIYVIEIIVSSDIKAVILNDLVGFCIGFVFLAVVSFVTRGALGFGDVKLFGIIGMTCGSFCTYSTLVVSLIVSAVVSVVSIVRKKMGRKDSFPFGPCITAGYVIAVLLTSY